jgi:prepilin-type N-terminal cleavage/methylation domain-containing protein
MVSLKIYTNNYIPKKGFTLLEVLIVLMMLSIIACSTLLFSFSFYSQNTLQAERNQLINLLQSARSQSMQNINSKSYGVRIDTIKREYSMFAGEYFSVSDPSKNIIISYADNLNFASNTPAEITFSQLSGQSSYEGKILIFIEGQSHSSTSISINSEGAIF